MREPPLRFLMIRVLFVIAMPLIVDVAQAFTNSNTICKNRDRTDPQIETDAAAVGMALRDGSTKSRKMIDAHEAWMKKQDNFSEQHVQPFSTHNQMFLAALLCADPADVAATVDPENKNRIEFVIDFWRADTNEIYETAKGHTVTPALIAGANQALNNNIRPDDRDQAVAQFNERARVDNQLMRIKLNSQGQLELLALPAQAK